MTNTTPAAASITTMSVYLYPFTEQPVELSPNASFVLVSPTPMVIDSYANQMAANASTVLDIHNVQGYGMTFVIEVNGESCTTDYNFRIQPSTAEDILIADLYETAATEGFPTDLTTPAAIVLHIPYHTHIEEEVTMTNNNTTVNNTIEVAPGTDVMSIVNNLSPEQLQVLNATLAQMQAATTPAPTQTEEATPMTQVNNTQAPTTAAPTVQAPIPALTEIAPTPWMEKAMDKLHAPNKDVFFSILMNLQAKSDEKVAAEIEEMLVAIEDNKAWEKTIEAQILAYKGWNNAEIGAIAKAAFKAGNATQIKVGGATHWVGRQIEKAGQAVQKKSNTVGAIAAAPFMVTGKVMTKKNFIPKPATVQTPEATPAPTVVTPAPTPTAPTATPAPAPVATPAPAPVQVETPAAEVTATSSVIGRVKVKVKNVGTQAIAATIAAVQN